MKYSIATVVAVAASLVAAQSITDIPTCALNCAITSLSSTGCSTSDIACICKANTFITGISSCVKSVCDSADYTKTLQVAAALCASAGVTLDVSSIASAAAGSSTSAAPSSTGATPATTTGSTSAAASSALSSVASSISSKISSAIASKTSTAGGAVSSVASSASSAAAAATSSKGAAYTQGANIALVAGAAALAFAL